MTIGSHTKECPLLCPAARAGVEELSANPIRRAEGSSEGGNSDPIRRSQENGDRELWDALSLGLPDALTGGKWSDVNASDMNMSF